jgi:serine/threonine protein kinase
MGAIPHVYDIFQYVGETRFTMDYIKGVSAVEAVGTAANPDSTWLQILAQVSLILGYLEEHIRLDHRDLKADNLWIRATPVDYKITIGGIKWHLKAPFQVVVLDFGFACLGNDDGHATVSLSDGIVPKIDPCPKEGRDLFQLIASMWSIPAIRFRASKEVNAAMEKLLAHKGSSYIDIVTHNLQTHWIYLAVSDSRFRYPPLHPVSLLLKLSNDWKEVHLQQE